jgi:hypothetical protein
MNELTGRLLKESGLLDYTKIVVPEHDEFVKLIINECVKEMGRVSKKAQEEFTYMGDDVPTIILQASIRDLFK